MKIVTRTTSTCGNMVYNPIDHIVEIGDTVRRRRPELSPCNYALHPVSVVEVHSICVRKSATNGYVLKGHYVHTALYSAAYASLRNRLKTKSRNDIKSIDWDMATFLGEFPQTVNMFTKLASDVASTYRSLRCRRRSGRKCLELWSKKVANWWLKYQYGLMPLIRDLQDACSVLSNGLSKPITLDIQSTVMDNVNQSWGNGTEGNPLRVIKSSIRMRNYIRVTAKNTAILPYKSLGLTNPIATTWNLIPYSFVFDSLINVGDWLSSFDALLGVSVCGHCEISELHESYAASDGKTTPTAKDKHLNRSFLDVSVGVPSFSRQSDSFVKLANMLALLRQLR